MKAVDPINETLLRSLPLPWPEENTDKHSRGTVLIAGGSAVSPGGATLSGIAALRAGAGKVLLCVPQYLALPIAVSFVEAGVHGLAVGSAGHPSPRAAAAKIADLARDADAVLLGPGLIDQTSAKRLTRRLLQTLVGPCFLIDAMCLVGLWNERRLLARHAGKVVITPHPGEMAALTGLSKERIAAEPIGIARKAAAHLGCIVVLKGAQTIVAAPDGGTFRYEGGGVGLATSGSGDVLAGTLAALVARRASPLQAAIWSVFLHGAAGRLLAERIGPLGYLARELAGELPALMESLRSR